MNRTHKIVCEIWLAPILGLAPIWIDQIDFVRILDDEDIYRRWLSGCDDDSNLSYRNSPVPFKVGPQEKVLPSGEGALFMSRLKSYKEEETKAEGRGRRRRRGGEAAAEVFSILSLSLPLLQVLLQRFYLFIGRSGCYFGESPPLQNDTDIPWTYLFGHGRFLLHNVRYVTLLIYTSCNSQS